MMVGVDVAERLKQMKERLVQGMSVNSAAFVISLFQ